MLITDVSINNKAVSDYSFKKFYRLQVIVYTDFSAEYPHRERQFRIYFDTPQNNDRMHLKDYEISHVVYSGTESSNILAEFFNVMVSDKYPVF